MKNYSHAKIAGNLLEDNHEFGMSLDSGDQLQIAQNTVRASKGGHLDGPGILVDGAQKVAVENNTIRDASVGMLLQAGSDLSIKENFIQNSLNHGIYSFDLKRGAIHQNTILDTFASGHYPGFACAVSVKGVSSFDITDNIIANTQGRGIEVEESSLGISSIHEISGNWIEGGIPTQETDLGIGVIRTSSFHRIEIQKIENNYIINQPEAGI